jgi:hypothetical protein
LVSESTTSEDHLSISVIISTHFCLTLLYNETGNSPTTRRSTKALWISSRSDICLMIVTVRSQTRADSCLVLGAGFVPGVSWVKMHYTLILYKVSPCLTLPRISLA